LMRSARSEDVQDSNGRPIATARVSSWVGQALQPAEWDIARAIAGDGVDAFVLPTEPARTEVSSTAAAGKSSLEILRALRVASLERIVRERSKGGTAVTRASVRAELGRGPSIRWIGDSIVCLVKS